MKVDQCQHCTVRGDFDACKVTPCNQHESWYAMTMQAKIAALEADAARYRGIRDKLTYVGINAHHKQELWCLRGVFADKGSFDEAIDDAMKGGA